MKKTVILCIILISMAVLTACASADTNIDTTSNTGATSEIESDKNYADTEKNVDYEMLGIKEYEYPSEFYMGDNLKTAITQLALSYDNFDKDSVESEYWQEIFVARFIQNTRSSLTI